MSAAPSAPSSGGGEIAALYEAKVRAELGVADRIAPGSDTIPWSGDPFAVVALVKGDPGPAEVAGGDALSGPDGEAARKALAALGFDALAVFATIARPETGIDPALLAERLRRQIEAVDPQWVIALDGVAAEFLADAHGLEALPFGRLVEAGGRALLALDGLETSLADDRAKERVWRQFRVLAPRKPSL